jgi:hypothetical protein
VVKILPTISNYGVATVFRIVAIVATGFALVSACAASQPAQRIIVGFEAPLVASSQAEMQQQVEAILQQPLELTQSSNDQRWIIVVDSRLNSDQIQNLIEKIQSLPEVRYAEPDGLLNAH